MGQSSLGTKVFFNCMAVQEKLLLWEKDIDYQITSELYCW